MSSKYDIIVAGAGLAGVCSALWLSENAHVLLLSGPQPAASSIAAGLVNPFAGLRARPVWNASKAYADFESLIAHTNAAQFFSPSGILRPAADSHQSKHYESAANDYPDRCKWLSSATARERHPSISAYHGMLLTTGGSVDIKNLLASAIRTLKTAGCSIRRNVTIDSWGETHDEAFVLMKSGERLRARTLILALGYGYHRFDTLGQLNLHSVKGQVIQTTIPKGLRLSHPVCGRGYIVPGDKYLTLGTTYDRGFSHTNPTDEATHAILRLTSKMIPAICNGTVVGKAAAVRVGVPGTRLPMVGPIGKRTWVFTGLGSKGLLFASHIARRLPNFIADPTLIPPEIRVQRLSSK